LAVRSSQFSVAVGSVEKREERREKRKEKREKRRERE
jgi:hypothetical protein